MITRKGRAVALLVGIKDMDPEQLDLGTSDTFWKLIAKRRKQKTISRSKLERKVDGGASVRWRRPTKSK